MVERQLPKLIVRVRFPSPAPSDESPGQDTSPEPGPASFLGRFPGRRAISVQLACRDEGPGGAVVIVALALLGLDVSVDRARDPLVRAARLVLVDQCRALAVVSHPVRGGAIWVSLLTKVKPVTIGRVVTWERAGRPRPYPISDLARQDLGGYQEDGAVSGSIPTAAEASSRRPSLSQFGKKSGQKTCVLGPFGSRRYRWVCRGRGVDYAIMGLWR